jgi:DNA polymerase-3 subunit gamma/tau
MAVALALKYRPSTFSDVTEQESVIAILQNQIVTKTHKNCYLFTGSAGTGKTTTARIFAYALNQGKGTPIEIDGASNNGIDQVRIIIDQAKMKSLDSEYKIYIIDECHAVTNAGWQAMLKLIEEPPKNTIFIMCTTDPQKIPATILSRVQRYDFRKISLDGVINRLAYILDCETQDGRPITFEEEAIEFIAKVADGGMRDAITLMDKCLSYNENLTMQNVLQALGASDYTTMCQLLHGIGEQDIKKCVGIIEDVYNSGLDLTQFMKQFWLFVLDVNKYNLYKDFRYLQLPATMQQELDKLINKTAVDLLDKLTELNADLKRETNVKQYVEATLFSWLGV